MNEQEQAEAIRQCSQRLLERFDSLAQQQPEPVDRQRLFEMWVVSRLAEIKVDLVILAHHFEKQSDPKLTPDEIKDWIGWMRYMGYL